MSDFGALHIEADGDGCRVWLKVVPGAKRPRVAGVLGDRLKLAVAQPPEGGAANRAVEALLAATLEVGAKDVSIVAGKSDPRKVARINGLSVDEARRRLGA